MRWGGGGGTSSTSATTSPEAVLYNFGPANSGDAVNPSSDLLIDSAGNLYGTTMTGGANNTGTVFKVSPSGIETVLHSFGPQGTTTDGIGPLSLAMDSSGNFYGTTQAGGLNGAGTLFKITPQGTETIIFSFAQSPTGRRLLIDSTDNAYVATTAIQILKISPSGASTVLASESSGNAALTGFVMDGSGNLYAGQGGYLAKLTPSGTLTLTGPFYKLFTPSELMIDSSGNIYLTTASTNGSIYKITPVLAVFTLYSLSGDNTSSSTMNHSDVVMDGSGNLYGTTSNDGANGVGSVYELSPAGAYTTLYSFRNSGDGAFPMAGLVMDSSGSLYGTTSMDGTYGTGTVFKIQ